MWTKNIFAAEVKSLDTLCFSCTRKNKTNMQKIKKEQTILYTGMLFAVHNLIGHIFYIRKFVSDPELKPDSNQTN